MSPLRTILTQCGGAWFPLETVVALDDGWLDATIVAAETVPSALAAGWHLLRSTFSGEPASRDDIGYVVTRRMVIETEPPQPLLIDGEVAGTSPLEVVSRPSSLLVFAPPAPPVDKLVERKLRQKKDVARTEEAGAEPPEPVDLLSVIRERMEGSASSRPRVRRRT